MPHKKPEARRESRRLWRGRNQEQIRAYKRAYRKNNRDRIAQYRRARRSSGLDSRIASPAPRGDYYVRYHSQNKNDAAYMAARSARDALRRQRTAKWANMFFISEIYHLARLRTKALGVAHEVDHKIPLRGKLVSGLHVENNLSILTKSENRSKAARFVETYHAL